MTVKPFQFVPRSWLPTCSQCDQEIDGEAVWRNGNAFHAECLLPFEPTDEEMVERAERDSAIRSAGSEREG